MEPSKNHEVTQYPSEHGDENLGPESLLHRVVDASGPTHAIPKPPEINFSETKPVRNYSIQTGEEFALEFMRDRVNPKNPFVTNISGDPSYAPGYLELKGILGINYTGSESGSDISMIERRNLSTTDYNSHCTLIGSLSLKLKILCSFGGRILPRPSDGKLRYVGGETRLVRIRKDITWRELWEKMIAIYDETHTIKYQLPGEDLDALVSVSSDEDLLNMMEECHDGEEGSRKFRMFLFSLADMEDAYFSQANNTGVDSEMKYVVAVNCMEIRPRRGSTLSGLAGSSGNNLNKMDTVDVGKETCGGPHTEFVGINTSNVPQTATESVLPNSSKVYETDVQFYHGQQPVHLHEGSQHPPQFGFNLHPSYHHVPSDTVVPQNGAISQQGGVEGKSLTSSGTQTQENDPVQLENGISGNSKASFPVEGSQVVVPTLDRNFSSKTSNPVQAVNQSQPINSESDPIYPSCSESSVPLQRVFHSERIPRQPSGQLSRISKSDDSHSSQFLVNHTITQHDIVTESTEKLQNGYVDINNPAEPGTFENGHPKTHIEYPLDAKAMHGNQEEAEASVPRNEQGDILIDINDRFPRDLLSDIFSKAILSDGMSDVGPLQKDGAGLSVNMENHEPQHWSFFQRLAGDEFTRRDVSLIDQDHVFSSGLTKVEEGSHLAYDFVPLGDQKDIIPRADGAVSVALRPDFDASRVKDSEGVRDDGMMDNTRIQDSDYEEGIGNIGLPPLDLSLVDFDINSLQFHDWSVDELQIIHNADLEELKELGSGTFGTTNEFWREAEILSKLHHPNVVAFYGVVQDGPGATLATVTEFMVDGSLRHVLLRKDRQLDRRKRLIIAMDAAFGMEYLHSKNIVHFDLKCDNLLVNLKDPSRPICKVGDFGLSKIKRNTLVSGGVRGTLPWMAPELLNGSSNKVSEKVDVFSFGIVLWEILTGEEPYANMHYGAIIGGIVNNTLRPIIPSYCDPEWRRLMEQCWAPNPVVRPCFTEIASRLRVMSQTRKAS
ncbi:dual specificity protein kinase shka [Phtheirospermum japonicum]|uniref:Dual specificity protein kinase shka n=1 Tax=Phtheirospermum japonicum TaxID=374723 RepID=A0A830CT05_9LAMI|nr:dual specificity protein kinase shka [Phtheirospermum japonicum]